MGLRTLIHLFLEKFKGRSSSRISWISIVLLAPKAKLGPDGTGFYPGDSPGNKQSPDDFRRQAFNNQASQLKTIWVEKSALESCWVVVVMVNSVSALSDGTTMASLAYTELSRPTLFLTEGGNTHSRPYGYLSMGTGAPLHFPLLP